MITIDGSYGEGGGQILRTSASFAAITGKAVRIENVRAGRAEPGLKAQHLTAIRAAMRLCNGLLVGDEKGSSEVEMTPGSPVQAGRYEFDIGTAGSTTLVLQTVLLPLLLAENVSTVTIQGGTHNTMAPSSDDLRSTFLRTSALPMELTVERVGFFPRGGGKIVAKISPGPIQPVVLRERGKRTLLTATVTSSDGLPSHILERAQLEIERRAAKAGWPLRVILAGVATPNPGVAVHLDAAFENGAGGFVALGRKGLPTERIVEDVWTRLADFEETDATVDEHLADQLILPALFATGPSEYHTGRVTEHLRTMAWLVPQFGVGQVSIGEAGRVVVRPMV